MNRDFKGVWIPKEIWLDRDLSMLDKGILTEIDSLCESQNGCYASNAYFAEFCQCTERKVSDAISKLIERGYVEVVAFDGRHRVLRSRLEKISRQTRKKCEADTKKVLAINTSINSMINTDINLSSTDDGLPDGFAEFWKIYPRHMDKAKAVTAWKGLKPGKKLIETILADVKYRNETVWKNKEKRFILMPTTYIHGKRWEDEHESDAPVMPSQPAQPIPNFMQPQARELTPDEQKAMYEAMENGTFFKNMG